MIWQPWIVDARTYIFWLTPYEQSRPIWLDQILYFVQIWSKNTKSCCQRLCWTADNQHMKDIRVVSAVSSVVVPRSLMSVTTPLPLTCVMLCMTSRAMTSSTRMIPSSERTCSTRCRRSNSSDLYRCSVSADVTAACCVWRLIAPAEASSVLRRDCAGNNCCSVCWRFFASWRGLVMAPEAHRLSVYCVEDRWSGNERYCKQAPICAPTAVDVKRTRRLRIHRRLM